MIADIFYGVVKEDCLQQWGQNHDPYDLVEEKFCIDRIRAWDFLFEADKIFTDKCQLDWGSFAYRCTREQLLNLTEMFQCGIEAFDDFDANKRYAVVFVEQP